MLYLLSYPHSSSLVKIFNKDSSQPINTVHLLNLFFQLCLLEQEEHPPEGNETHHRHNDDLINTVDRSSPLFPNRPLKHKMHLNDLCAGTGNQFNLIQQPTYPADASSAQSINQQQSANLHTSLNTSLNSSLNTGQTGPQTGLPNQLGFQGQLADNSSQLNSSLSSSSGVGCTSSSSSGLGTTSSLFSNSSSGLSNNPNHSTMNGNSSHNGSVANHVLLPLSELGGGGGHGLQRAQLISNLNGSSNQYTTLTFPNNHHYYSSTSSPSSVNTAGTGSTLPSTVPINGQSANQSANSAMNASLNGSLNGSKVYAVQNAPMLSNDNVYCQTTSFTNSAIMDNTSMPVTGHYQLLTGKHQQSNYHLPNGLTPSVYSTMANSSPSNSYLLQTVPANQSPNYAGNLHQQSLNYLNHDELNKQFNLNASAQFDLICDNRLVSPVYSKLSPNSNSLIKECLITNAENALNRNSSKFIELTSSQNSTASVYSDTLKSRLAGSQSSKDNLKMLQAASTGLDLLNCDKTYNEIIKASGDQLKSRTDSLGKLNEGRCKEVCKNRKKCKDKCTCRPVKSDKSGLKEQAAQQQCQLATKVAKSGHWCCSSSGDNPRKQGIWLILLATCILVLLLGFLTLTSNAKFASLLGKSLCFLLSATISGQKFGFISIQTLKNF